MEILPETVILVGLGGFGVLLIGIGIFNLGKKPTPKRRAPVDHAILIVVAAKRKALVATRRGSAQAAREWMEVARQAGFMADERL